MDHFTRDELSRVVENIIGERIPGRPAQDISDVASTIQNYTIGSRLQLGGRTFHYAKTGGVVASDWAVKNNFFQHVTYAVVAAVAAGVSSVVVTVAATDGNPATGAIGLNELAGGYAVLFSSVAHVTQNRRVIANTAVVAPGGAMTVTLDKPLTYALTAVARIEIVASPYAKVFNDPAQESYQSVVGVPTVSAILNQYIWVQTWGPLWTNSDLNVSLNPNNRLVKFGPDANLHPVVAADAFNSTQGQIAGFVLANRIDYSQGAPFIFLTIDP